MRNLSGYANCAAVTTGKTGAMDSSGPANRINRSTWSIRFLRDLVRSDIPFNTDDFCSKDGTPYHVIED